ncbi:WG repeat-containing protein [Reichenbachiella ulvae]|uniref:WG repeat-containing protein n=1 Tax=Reichenbachiella ulvae TaxID=2980104 RepID=A0ABT3CP70_9BACT|nr:WG repeat-containing protein [Reichenbachiella ulvae]MCV9385491.1 WG repeat-containing protein [Reichenbachiella ulvae]
MKSFLTIIALVLSVLFSHAQFPEKELKKKLKADRIEMDEGNGDGVFKARNKKTKKWGMYQWQFEGLQTQELIPMQYDSVRYFPFNGNYTAVYQGSKVGFYLSYWSYGDEARETVACIYDDYKRFTAEGVPKLAVKKNESWGWVDWMTGEEKSEFKYATPEDLPYPYYKQEY